MAQLVPRLHDCSPSWTQVLNSSLGAPNMTTSLAIFEMIYTGCQSLNASSTSCAFKPTSAYTVWHHRTSLFTLNFCPPVRLDKDFVRRHKGCCRCHRQNQKTVAEALPLLGQHFTMDYRMNCAIAVSVLINLNLNSKHFYLKGLISECELLRRLWLALTWWTTIRRRFINVALLLLLLLYMTLYDKYKTVSAMTSIPIYPALRLYSEPD